MTETIANNGRTRNGGKIHSVVSCARHMKELQVLRLRQISGESDADDRLGTGIRFLVRGVRQQVRQYSDVCLRVHEPTKVVTERGCILAVKHDAHRRDSLLNEG